MTLLLINVLITVYHGIFSQPLHTAAYKYCPHLNITRVLLNDGRECLVLQFIQPVYSRINESQLYTHARCTALGITSSAKS